MNKIYLVKYYGGSYDDAYEYTIFATITKSKAIKYTAKFNRILKKWKQHYAQYEENKYDIMPWLKDDYVEKYFHRWSQLRDITKCYYEEIEIR